MYVFGSERGEWVIGLSSSFTHPYEQRDTCPCGGVGGVGEWPLPGSGRVVSYEYGSFVWMAGPVICILC